jgi:3-oxocholest-4-en-26-oyl-CoA dehydrogenase beta subunit
VDATIGEDAQALRDLARQIFTDLAPAARVAEVEASPERFDRALWAELARAGLLAAALPDDVGGAGLGLVEAALVCAEHGRSVAPVPLAWTVAAALTVAEHCTAAQRDALLAGVAAGDLVMTCAPPSASAGVTVVDGVLSGTVVAVPYAHVAAGVLVPVGDDVYLVDQAGPGVAVRPGEATSREVHAELVCAAAPAERVGAGRAGWLADRLLVLLAATQAGVTDAAVRLTADYTSHRMQFGKPLSSFQGVAMRAADAYVDAAGISLAVLQAAWRLDSGWDARAEVLTAAWWAAEAGQRCVHATQHLHGGMGADITYPVHRYFLWGKQIELLVGGASALLARLGDVLATLDDPGDALLTLTN